MLFRKVARGGDDENRIQNSNAVVTGATADLHLPSVKFKWRLEFFPFELDGRLGGTNDGSLKFYGSRLIVDVTFGTEGVVINSHYICITLAPFAYSELRLKRA